MFLLLFLGVEASAFHSMTHEDSEEAIPCEVCTLVIQNQLEDFDPPAEVTVPDEVVNPITKKDLDKYFIAPYHKDIWMRYFSRPPPQLA